MVEVIVTRGGQITLTNEIRNKLRIKVGDLVIMNVLGETVLVSKKDPNIFDKHNFLPENFSKVIEDIRRLPLTDRLKKLKIIE